VGSNPTTSAKCYTETVPAQRSFFLILILMVISAIALGVSFFTLYKVQTLANRMGSQVVVQTVDKSSLLPTPSPTLAPTLSDSTQSPATQAALAALQKKQDQLQSQIDTLKQKSTTTTTTDLKKQKEYILYVGSGSTINREWTLLPTATITIDPSNYSGIKEVRFEAGQSIINGEAHARLVDLTTSTPFYSSEVFSNTSAGSWVTSSAFQLPAQSHQYGVEIKSTSGDQANLIGARIKIVVN
jgi:hypothetical protein